MIESLRENGDDSPVWVMALDDEVPARIAEVGIPGVTVIRLKDLEQANPRLLTVKDERERMEYVFTTTAFFIPYVMDHSAPGTSVAYLDADLRFFSAPQQIWDTLGEGSIGIFPHRFAPSMAQSHAKYGTYNAGVIAFRDDARSRVCLDWWADRCIEWCSDFPESDGRYANQGYLDRFAERFDGVKSMSPAGLNAAPWNTAASNWTVRGERVLVGDDPLVFFHFHGVKRVGGWWVTSQLRYRSPMSRVLRERVYRPYVASLEGWERQLGLEHRSTQKRGGSHAGVLTRMRHALIHRVSIVTGNAVRAGHGT
jgi:hypothetical protein